VGVSRCLLGDLVRYDGRHRRDACVVEVLGPMFEFVPVCPEVEIGLPVPRPPIQLVRVAQGIRVRGVEHPEVDVGDALAGLLDEAADRFAGLAGFLLKARSPSCGRAGVPVHDERGRPVDSAPGAFAAAVLRRYPGLPVLDEGRLADPRLRDEFVASVFDRHHRLTNVEQEPIQEIN